MFLIIIIKERINELSFIVALLLQQQLQLQLQPLQYTDINYNNNTVLHKNLYLGHLNMISWCTYAFYVDVNVLLLLLQHTRNDQKKLFLWYNSHKIMV